MIHHLRDGKAATTQGCTNLHDNDKVIILILGSAASHEICLP